MLIESLEGRRMLCGVTSAVTSTDVFHNPLSVHSPVASSALAAANYSTASATVVRPSLFVFHPDTTTAHLGTYAGDLTAGSTLEGVPASGQFKLVLSTYNASTDTFTGKLYVDKLTVEGHGYPNYSVSFTSVAHLTSTGAFDAHVTGNGFNVKVKGDYKRSGAAITGNTNGTYTFKGTAYNLALNYSITKRS